MTILLLVRNATPGATDFTAAKAQQGSIF